MIMRGRRGNTLVVVLAITLLLASQIYIVNVLSTGNFRQVEKVNAHVRAIYVGESALSKMIARLKAESWAKRWFASGSVEENNVPMAGGTYNCYAATVPTLDGTKEAEFWVRARYEGSVVAMFSRVKYVDDTLDFHAQAFPTFFTFLPPEGGPPLAGTRTRTDIDNWINTRRDNRQRARDMVERIKGKRDLAALGFDLQIPGIEAGVDVTLLPGSTTLVPQAGRLAEVDLSLSVGLPALPLLTDPNLTLAASLGPSQATPFNDPREVQNYMASLLAQKTIPVPTEPPVAGTETYFKNPNEAGKQWNDALREVPPPWGKFAKKMEHLGKVGKEMAEMMDKPSCQGCREVLDNVLAFMRREALEELARNPRASPLPKDVDPAPFQPSDYEKALHKYGEWFKKEAEKKQ